MNVIWSSEIDNILNVGLFLGNVGISNWALTKAQALAALEQFSELEIPILGGDVCEDVDGRVSPNYDSWHSDPLPNEVRADFLARSITSARAYIDSYPILETRTIFFTFVPDI